MKTLITITTILLLSASAQASYWTCVGKKITAQFGQNAHGLIFKASSIGSEIPGDKVYSKVKLENISFSGKGRSMKDVKALFVSDEMFEAGLNIKDGGFYLANQNGVILFDENMRCSYTAGE